MFRTQSINRANLETDVDALLDRCATTVAAIAPQLPSWKMAQEVMAQIEPATQRGYFLPDEDEAIRELFSKYLTTRAALMATLEDLRPHALREVRRPSSRQHDVFLVAFCTACLLVRAGRFIVDTFRKQPVIWRKLDEAEPRFGIPARQFTAIYRSLTSPLNSWTFMVGIHHFQQHEAAILAARESAALNGVVSVLREELPFLDRNLTYYTTGGIKYRWHSFLRRNHSGFKKFTFGAFKVSGSVIAEMRWWSKRKRVGPAVQRKIARLLQPGDVIITRHDDAASNLFLPGFWPHGALYLGTEIQRQSLAGSAANKLMEQLGQCRDPLSVLEARKDGVLFRPLDDTLGVDACTVIRPRLTPELIGQALARAMTHQGKPYDFEFDFRRSDKLVCTEVIYRAYHGLGPMRFQLSRRAGRVCLSAEDLLNTALDGSLFDVLLVYGAQGNRFVSGPAAREALRLSYRRESIH